MAGVIDTPLGAAGRTVERSVVPWTTVAPLAVVMAYGDGFWIMSLRGTVGDITRADAPFSQWLLESTVVLPVFVFAVLGALALALRLFGPALRRPRTVLATGLLVAAAGTLAGFVELLASSAYDYHLQAAQLGAMTSMGTSMGGLCGGSCEAQQLQATFDLQLRAVGYGSLILVASNLLLVAWVVALRGGRLDPGRPRPARVGRSRLFDLRILLAVGLVASAVIHAAVVPEHLEEWSAAGDFFVLLTAAEIVAAVLVVAHPGLLSWLVAGVLSVGPLALWSYSRTLGMPFGPEAGVPEAIGVADVAACALELGTLVAAIVAARARGWLRQPPMSAQVARLALVAVVAVAVIGLAGSGIGWFAHIDVATMTMAHG